MVRTRACDDEHAGFTKHEGDEIVLNASHNTLSFYACDPETGSHSKTVTYQLAVATGVDEINAADASEVVYFNLQGVRVANPENGTYIRVTNGKADKVMK